MTAVAALAFGVFAYAAAGVVLGHPVRLRVWRRPRPAIGDRQTWLTQAGAALTPRQFWSASIGCGVVALAIGTLLTGAPVVALVPAVAVATLPRTWFARQRAARMRALQSAWPDALRDVVASIAAGRSLGAAVGELATTGPEPLRGAFERFPATARLLGVAPALDLVKESLADPTSDRVLEVLILASERGGRIVQEILDDLVVTTTKDLKVLDEIDSESLEMKINARAVLVLPWLVLLALTFRGGAFRDFYQSGAGVLVVIIGGGLSAAGYVWISRLGRTLDERRVFGGARAGAAVTR
jgi:tight adherence protein B